MHELSFLCIVTPRLIFPRDSIKHSHFLSYSSILVKSATFKTNLGKNCSQFWNFFPFCLTLLRSSHYAKLVHFLFSTVKALLNADEERIHGSINHHQQKCAWRKKWSRVSHRKKTYERGRALARSINGFMARKRDLQRKFCLSPILLLLL